MARYKVVGPPGTGKTRRLLNTVHKYVKDGTRLDQIGYFAFTRKAAGEARDRFLAQNQHLDKKDVKYFQTLHSLAFNNLSLKVIFSSFSLMSFFEILNLLNSL